MIKWLFFRWCRHAPIILSEEEIALREAEDNAMSAYLDRMDELRYGELEPELEELR